MQPKRCSGGLTDHPQRSASGGFQQYFNVSLPRPREPSTSQKNIRVFLGVRVEFPSHVLVSENKVYTVPAFLSKENDDSSMV